MDKLFSLGIEFKHGSHRSLCYTTAEKANFVYDELTTFIDKKNGTPSQFTDEFGQRLFITDSELVAYIALVSIDEENKISEEVNYLKAMSHIRNQKRMQNDPVLKLVAGNPNFN